MDQQWSAEPIRVLTGVVRMVPVCSWLIDLFSDIIFEYSKDGDKQQSYLEDLSKSFSWADLTLGYPGWAIHGVSSVLEEAMEMQASALITELIGKVYRNLFTNVGGDSWRRPLPIDSNHRPLLQAIRICRKPANVPVVRDSRYATAESKKARYKDIIELHCGKTSSQTRINKKCAT